MERLRKPFPRVALIALAVLSACSSTRSPQLRPTATPAVSMLKNLKTITSLGSTLDPLNGDQNPYGLAVAPVSAGLITAGDLIVCNFNDGPTNTQGKGTTIIGLHPVPGASPYHIAQDPSLLGCNALALNPSSDNIWTADFAANDNAIFSPSGQLLSSQASSYPWSNPFGEISASVPGGSLAFYVSNAGNGNITRVDITNGTIGALTTIATGFSVNHGAPGSILGPSGLTYDPSIDTLYIVDGNANRVVAFANASKIPANGIVVSGGNFSGPSASSARIIASGPPINGPISGALLPNGNLVIGNTLDPKGTNLLIEISPSAGVIATKNVDTNAGAALFGIAVTGTVASPTIYFNDDNTNTVDMLSR